MFLRVWYNGRTSAFQADDAGPIPATRSTFIVLRLLFLLNCIQNNECPCSSGVERILGKDEVASSILAMGSKAFSFKTEVFSLDIEAFS